MNIRHKLNIRLLRINANKTWIKLTILGLTFGLCIIPLGYNIGAYCIQSWDESRNVVNAIEMLKNHQWFVRYFDHHPDMWELKPPFVIWCQAMAIHFFGLSEISVRLPSVVFSMGTVFFLIWMSQKITKHIFSGCLASLILVSSQGYIGEHVARFGDHDVVLVFFFTVFVGLSYLYFTSPKPIYLIGLFVALFLGWFTKSIIIFMSLPGLVIWLLLTNQFIKQLKVKGIWIGSLILITLLFAYYLIREKASPDYIHQVWMNELFGRYFDTSTNYHYQKNEFWYYWLGMLNGRFWPFITLLLGASFIVIFKRNFTHRRFLVFLIVQSFVFFLILSAGTKNFWYDVPLYPMACLIIAIVWVQLVLSCKPLFLKILGIGASVLVMFSAYTKTVNYAIAPDPNRDYPLQSMCYYLKNKLPKLPKALKIVTTDHPTPLYFYIAKAKKYGAALNIAVIEDLKMRDTVLLNSSTLRAQLNLKFKTKTIDKQKQCELICLEALLN